MAKGVSNGSLDETTVRRLWWAALDTLQENILGEIDLTGGVWLASPLPALYEPKLLDSLKGWVWSPEGLESLPFRNTALLPPSRVRSIHNPRHTEATGFRRLPLRSDDGMDPLLIVITSQVQIALALYGQKAERSLIVRSDLETVQDILQMIFLRLELEDLPQALELKQVLEKLVPLQKNHEISRTFWPLIAEKLAGFTPSLTIQTLPDRTNLNNVVDEGNAQTSLLEAITHEVRTPLATIRTLIRSLLRRNDISEVVLTRLKQIDSECTEQIDRFGLIFKAVELERKELKNSGLAITDLGNMLTTMYPIWSQQLDRRGLTLKLEIAKDLPNVLSDPAQLELMLGGLIDRNSRGLQSGGILVLQLNPAGHRLKLQIFSEACNSQSQDNIFHQSNSDLGTVLSWNPSTGSLQLSHSATQRLLASLGGRLTHRKEKGLIIFFPIAENK